MSVGGAAPWDAGVLVVVGTGDTGTGGDAGGDKGDGNGRYGGEGIWV